MNQVISEAEKTGFKVKGCVLASRKHLCLNEEIMKEKSLNKINKKCRSLLFGHGGKCRFSSNFSEKKGKYNIKPLVDIEDMRRFGDKNMRCPFYFARYSIKTANLIVLSYNYMSDPILREKLKEYFQRSIVVIDEGHNITGVFEKAGSFEYSMANFETVKKEVLKIINKLKKSVGQEIKTISKCLDKLTCLKIYFLL